MRRLVIVLALFLSLGAADAFAQDSTDPYERWNGTRDKVGFDVGAYFVNHSTFTRLQPRGLPDIPGVDLESDINMPSNTADFRLDGYVRFGRRHRVRVGWWSMKRTVIETLSARLEWGDEVFEATAEVGARWDTRIIKADYRFAAVKTDRVDFGVALGVFLMKVDSGVGINDGGAPATTDTAQSAPLPMLGLDVEYGLARKWLLKGFVQYFAIALDGSVDGSWVEARAAVEYMPWRNVGFGIAYNYARVDVQLQFSEGRYTEFDYRYRIAGPHLFVAARF